MSSAVTVGWTLHDAGWATATFAFAGREPVAMAVSHFHDSLGDLAQALVAMDGGAKEVTVVLMDEPGEHHIVLRRSDDALVEIEIRWFAAWASWKMHPLDRFDVVARGLVRWRTFRGEVVSMLQGVFEEHGLHGYREKWGKHDFPSSELRQLEAARRK